MKRWTTTMSLLLALTIALPAVAVQEQEQESEPEAAAITIPTTEITLEVGETFTLEPVVTDADGNWLGRVLLATRTLEERDLHTDTPKRARKKTSFGYDDQCASTHHASGILHGVKIHGCIDMCGG